MQVFKKMLRITKKEKFGIAFAILLLAFSVCMAGISGNLQDTKIVSASNLSNTKIGWGIKRNDSNEQPDVGAENRKILEENNRNLYGEYWK